MRCNICSVKEAKEAVIEALGRSLSSLTTPLSKEVTEQTVRDTLAPILALGVVLDKVEINGDTIELTIQPWNAQEYIILDFVLEISPKVEPNRFKSIVEEMAEQIAHRRTSIDR